MPASKRLTGVGTKHWKQAVPPHLSKPLKRALDASEAGDVGTALKWFGVCADKCHGIDDPTLRPILYFGAQAASTAYFGLRGAGQEVPQSHLEQWRFCAETLIRSAWQVCPGDPVAAHNVGRFLHDCDEWEQAIAMYRIALQLKPEQVESWGNLGTAYANMGDRVAAERCWGRCIAFEAENPSGALAQAYVYLRNGDYLEGWKRWEHRWQEAEFGQGYGRKELTGKRWTGEPLTKKHTLYVHGEQGLGDHVMFARYVPLLIERGINVVALETRPTLVRWMEAALPGVPIIARRDGAEHIPVHTHHVSSMSLPYLLGSTTATVPPPVGPQMPFQLRRRVVDGLSLNMRSLRVALAWTGATGNPADGVRSIPADQLQMLACLDVEWVSVQFTPDAGMIARSWLGCEVEDATETCKDVLDTAKVLAGCDLCVTVDTLTAHIAGSLGIPTIVLHRFDREWRWFEAEKERSIWYPTVRQWTQERPYEWASLLQRVRTELGG